MLRKNITLFLFFVILFCGLNISMFGEDIVDLDLSLGANILFNSEVTYNDEINIYMQAVYEFQTALDFLLTDWFLLGINIDIFYAMDSTFANNLFLTSYAGATAGINSEFVIIQPAFEDAFSFNLQVSFSAGWAVYPLTDHLFFLMKGKIVPKLIKDPFYISFPFSLYFLPEQKAAVGIGVSAGLKI